MTLLLLSQALASTGGVLRDGMKGAVDDDLGSVSPLLQRLLHDVTSLEVRCMTKWLQIDLDELVMKQLVCFVLCHRQITLANGIYRCHRWLALPTMCSASWTRKRPAPTTNCSCSPMRIASQKCFSRFGVLLAHRQFHDMPCAIAGRDQAANGLVHDR